jgi:hypothetical protein
MHGLHAGGSIQDQDEVFLLGFPHEGGIRKSDAQDADGEDLKDQVEVPHEALQPEGAPMILHQPPPEEDGRDNGFSPLGHDAVKENDERDKEEEQKPQRVVQRHNDPSSSAMPIRRK